MQSEAINDVQLRPADLGDLPTNHIHSRRFAGFQNGGACLILLMRHLGDAVIASGLMNALHRFIPHMPVDVLGRAQLKEVAKEFGHFRDYIEIDVPLFGHHRRDSRALRSALNTIRLVRRRRYTYCINTIGDARENLIGKLTAAQWNIAPIWARDHIFKRKMNDRGAAMLTNCGVAIPARLPSYYESMNYFANALGLPALEWKRAPDRGVTVKPSLRVGLHPGASHPSRHWPDEKWRDLVDQLHRQGCTVRILGAVAERNRLLAAFDGHSANRKLDVVTGDIPQFVSALADCDVLIGMDSFAVHAAYSLGVPAVVLNGSADPAILTPPGYPTLSAGHLCNKFPCYYAYPCARTQSEYVCVRGIGVETVLSALNAMINNGRQTNQTV